MTITALSDGRLLEQVRQGDEAAFTELYVRHQPAALRLARTYRRWADPDSLVNGAFERAAVALRRGPGPDECFRAYVFVTLRQLAVERHLAATAADGAGGGEAVPQDGDAPPAGAAAGEPSTAGVPADGEPSTAGVPADGEPSTAAAPPPGQVLAPVPAAIAALAREAGERDMPEGERRLVGRAFDLLPDRWQVVLWHVAVEGHEPVAIAEALGVSEAAATAMRFRARELFRQACLDDGGLQVQGEHEPYRSHLGAHARGTLPPAERAAVDGHLHRCDECRAVAASLADADRTVARAFLPLFLLVGGGTLGVDPAASAAAPGLLARLRHVAPAVGSTAAIAAVLGGIVGMGALVGREHAGPLSSTADAADIGAGPDEVDGEPWDGGTVDRDDRGGTLFGEDDFALSPFDDDRRDLGDFGDRLDIGRRRSLGDGRIGFGGAFGAGPGSTSRSSVSQSPSTVTPRTTSPPSPRPPASPPRTPTSQPRPPASPAPPSRPPTSPPATTPPTTSPPTTSPPTTSPPTTSPPTTSPPTTSPPTTSPPTTSPPTTSPPTTTPPAPAPLTFAGASWQPTGVGAGTLTFTIAEAAGAPSGGAAAPAGSLVLRVTLDGPATFANSGLPARCGLADATTAECGFDQPPPGGTVPPLALPVVVGGPGATASAEILRDGDVEATLAAPVSLTPFESGLSVAYPAGAWAATGPGAGTLRMTVTQAEGWDVDGLAVTAALTDGAGLGGGGTPGCADLPVDGGPGVTCPVPTVPGGGSVEVVVPLTIAGEAEQAVRLVLRAGATILATVEEAVALPAP